MNPHIVLQALSEIDNEYISCYTPNTEMKKSVFSSFFVRWGAIVASFALIAILVISINFVNWLNIQQQTDNVTQTLERTETLYGGNDPIINLETKGFTVYKIQKQDLSDSVDDNHYILTAEISKLIGIENQINANLWCEINTEQSIKTFLKESQNEYPNGNVKVIQINNTKIYYSFANKNYRSIFKKGSNLYELIFDESVSISDMISFLEEFID
ncbi:hypothetical protein [Ruminococcus sp. YE282]|jgi:hypothetical protein|uniref:hypothetical protein n=1 Tax=Ruminococcus sp. YE282 TaxID=3158780 RepID=UPI00088EAAA8|nr:hypothetical protein [uncultured Methanobrevibacter sp.]SCY49419.1 hypothetical protein SAMN02910441_01586 [Ruminococcus bromii]